MANQEYRLYCLLRHFPDRFKGIQDSGTSLISCSSVRSTMCQTPKAWVWYTRFKISPRFHTCKSGFQPISGTYYRLIQAVFLLILPATCIFFQIRFFSRIHFLIVQVNFRGYLRLPFPIIVSINTCLKCLSDCSNW